MIETVIVPPAPVFPEMQLVAHPVDPLVLESIFLAPGRNDPCYCASGDKYKRCCQPVDQEAWRVVSLKTRQVDAVCATLPPSLMKTFNLEEV